MSNEQYSYLEGTVEEGMFDNEFYVTLHIGGQEITSTVDKSDIRITTPLSKDRHTGRGLVRVRIVQVEQNGDLLVDLPRSSFTAQPRLKVPKESLVTA
jgi:hypothetical protein